MEGINKFLLLQLEIKMTWSIQGKYILKHSNIFDIEHLRQITCKEAQTALGNGVLYVLETSAAESQDSIDILLASAIKVGKPLHFCIHHLFLYIFIC